MREIIKTKNDRYWIRSWLRKKHIQKLVNMKDRWREHHFCHERRIFNGKMGLQCLRLGIWSPFGDPSNGVNPGTPFEDLPEDWFVRSAEPEKTCFRNNNPSRRIQTSEEEASDRIFNSWSIFVSFGWCLKSMKDALFRSIVRYRYTVFSSITGEERRKTSWIFMNEFKRRLEEGEARSGDWSSWASAKGMVFRGSQFGKESAIPIPPNTTYAGFPCSSIRMMKIYLPGRSFRIYRPWRIGSGPNQGPVTTNHQVRTSMKISKSGSLYALALCNIHGLWQSTKKIAFRDFQ